MNRKRAKELLQSSQNNTMNRKRAKELLPLIQAYADGKAIQYLRKGRWEDIDPPSWFDEDQYRIKPEPKLRPWKPEEVPVGAQARYKENPKSRFLILYISDTTIHIGGDGYRGVDYMLYRLEHSIDNGKTWLPCGVMEE